MKVCQRKGNLKSKSKGKELNKKPSEVSRRDHERHPEELETQKAEGWGVSTNAPPSYPVMKLQSSQRDLLL